MTRMSSLPTIDDTNLEEAMYTCFYQDRFYFPIKRIAKKLANTCRQKLQKKDWLR